jgi:hypothetical protein
MTGYPAQNRSKGLWPLIIADMFFAFPLCSGVQLPAGRVQMESLCPGLSYDHSSIA